MGEDFELTTLDQAAIVAVAILILLIVLSITACFVVPGCLGYACLRRKDKESDEMLMIQRAKKKFSIKLTDHPSPLYQSSHLKTLETQDTHYNVPRSLFNGNYTPTTYFPFEVVEKPSIIRMSLSFSSQQDITELGRLSLHIIEALNIPSRDYPVLPDSTTKILMAPKRFSIGRNEKPIHQVQTRLIKSTKSPTYNQSFVLSAAATDLKTWVMKILVIDEDRLTRSRVTCRAKIHLRELKNLSSGQELPLELNLEPVIYDHGQLLIALSYLPTSQRLSVSVMKASKLDYIRVVADLAEFRPCVKISLLDHSGKILKKKKVTGDFGLESPSFTGSVCFQVSPIAYETSTLLFVVTSENPSGEIGDDAKKTESLGYAALGWIVKEESGRDHWRAVLQTPRKIITQWHTLR